LIHWHWFAQVVSGFIACLFCRRYTQYRNTKLQFGKDEKKAACYRNFSAFADLGIGGGMKSNLDNEIVLKSRTWRYGESYI
jgi:hypothetical protein